MLKASFKDVLFEWCHFDILPYINADPIVAKQLEGAGCVTVMPLGSPIGSGQGLKNIYNIKILMPAYFSLIHFD